MRIVIIGGGISGVYLANTIKKHDTSQEVLILSQEAYPPYDRIHLCTLIDKSETLSSITLALNPTVKLELNQKILQVEPKAKKIFSKSAVFSYDKLIIATGSLPKTLFEIKNLDNVSVFRNKADCQKITSGIFKKEVVIVGSGPIGLELLDTLNSMQKIKKITLLVRNERLYDNTLSNETNALIEKSFLKNKKVHISYNDEIVDKKIQNSEIISLTTKKLHIDNPFIIFGIGIKPNIEFAKNSLKCDRGILVDSKMQTSISNIYAVGEAAEIKASGFIAGHVKECTLQADVAIADILGFASNEFSQGVSIDMLKVGSFDLVDIRSANFSKEFEKILITSEKDNRIDEYYISQNTLARFIGINSNVDVAYLEDLITNERQIDPSYLYQNRVLSKRGRLICGCEHIYYQDLVDLVTQNAIRNFSQLSSFSEAGRVCGKCKKMFENVIFTSQKLIDPTIITKSKEDILKEQKLKSAQKRVEKFKKLHAKNGTSEKELENAMAGNDISDLEFNRWISMITANMRLHPEFEKIVKLGVKTLNKVPVIWLELSDCSGNSEAFIKSTNPSIEELIFEYISLDYHELLMSASGERSENTLDNIIKMDKGKYILIVEGAVPLGMDGKFLRIGSQGETGISLLKRCAKDAAMILAVGSCAFDGGVVAAEPNPTAAVGVSEALKRDDIINISGCPANPINIVGTLLYYLMFEELPALDKESRPLWAYQGRIHDNCERRGHYDLGEFVKEWGDEGSKKGWCLFEVGCKGPFAFANCPTMKFNDSTSWPVQAGHGCIGCVEKGFFDKYANERKIDEKDSY
jgi:quinone-reactive Ni/Fe-hydrogenase small subunit